MNLEIEDTFITVEKQDDNLLYRRFFREEEKNNDNLIVNNSFKEKELAEILLLNDDCDILITPIEPVNIPKPLSSFLLIEFNCPVIIGPGEKKKIYITFPVEIGVFFKNREGDYEIIDMFTFSKVKFTLYGSHTHGLICKYWASDVFTNPPETDILREGYIELDIINDSSSMMQIEKTVFNAYGMKIYYGDKRLAMKASLRIINKLLAETDFSTYPTTSRFKRSMELYTSRKLTFSRTKGIMEFGL
ncbi:MAG: DUF432 domain-containing protein [Methanolobus sp.]|nr:DUF432 domain-containing protein [Methanolobus sp.]